METLSIHTNGDKESIYLQLLPQLEALLQGEVDLIANMANVCAVLKDTFKCWWVGFYLVKGEELVLGPFQGPVACTRIGYGKGVCGTAWKNNSSLVVPNVDLFPGHIACSSESRSEIVVPVLSSQKDVLAVLDIDSQFLSHFDDTDEKYLKAIVSLLRF